MVAGEDRALYFPAPGLTPYQEGSASLPVRAQEVLALDRLLSASPGDAGGITALVATPRALFQRLPEPADLARRTLQLSPGEDWPRELLVEHLAEAGYQRVDLVAQVGDAAVRGGVIDVWPPGEPLPLRLDLFGDTLESIRGFDPVSQRSGEALSSARLLPLSLFDGGVRGRARLAEALAAYLPAPESGRRPSMEAVERLHSLTQGVPFAGWEALLPLGAMATTWLPALLPGALPVVVDPLTLGDEIALLARRLEEDYEVRCAHGELTAPPSALLVPGEDVIAFVDAARLQVGGSAPAPEPPHGAPPIDFGGTTTDLFHGQLPRFPREVEARARPRRAPSCSSPPEERYARPRRAARRRATSPSAGGGVELVAGELERGFRLPAAGVAVYGETQLAAPRPPAARRRAPQRGPLRRLPRGPARPQGRRLRRPRRPRHRPVPGAAHGRPAPEAAGGAPLPAADARAPPPAAADTRGDGDPLRRRQAPAACRSPASTRSRSTAASRGSRRGSTSSAAPPGTRPRTACATACATWRRSCSSSTPSGSSRRRRDPRRRLRPRAPVRRRLRLRGDARTSSRRSPAILGDLEQRQPMDRLLCGDVGFGKTEVAMRAAFRAVDAGYQVAVLAPTTILADQHLETFRRRFEGLPVTIERISRFRSPARSSRTSASGSPTGKVDILIGTHRLLSKDIALPRLALLIVDEEQRFGVAQKERLQAAQEERPRARHVGDAAAAHAAALARRRARHVGDRDAAARTAWRSRPRCCPSPDELVREAIEYELERGGQVYYVYNRVESIEQMAGVSARAGARPARHRRPRPARRARALRGGCTPSPRGEYDLLLASTIIENGIDIPTRQHHDRAPRRPLRPGPALPAARPRRPQQRARLLLPAGARRTACSPQDARKRLDALARVHRARRRLPHRRPRPRDPRRRQPARRRAERPHRRARHRDLSEDARGDRARAERRGGGGGAFGDRSTCRCRWRSRPTTSPTPTCGWRSTASSPAGEVPRRGAARRAAPTASARRRQAVYALLEVARLKRARRARCACSRSRRSEGELVIRLRRDARIDPERLVELVSTRADASFSPAGVLTLRPRGGELLDVARGTLERLAS